MTSDDDENSGRKTLGDAELEEVSGCFTVYILLLINM